MCRWSRSGLHAITRDLAELWGRLLWRAYPSELHLEPRESDEVPLIRCIASAAGASSPGAASDEPVQSLQNLRQSAAELVCYEAWGTR